MTSARQQRKPWPALGPAFGLALGLTFFGAISPSPELWAAAGDRIVLDPQTGLAISGFDPVAYFTDAKPKIGRPEVELRLDGTIWRFRNEGNRAAFAEHPEVYTPRFGGYDPVAIARGNSVPGHPLFWAVSGERLYLFYSATERAAFLADTGRIIDAAERKWPNVVRTIGR
jgi:hypothetical protein